MTIHQALQDHFRRDELLHVNGITTRSGRVILISATTLRTARGVKCAAAPLAETTVSSVLKFRPSAWVTVTATERLTDAPGWCFLAGEGAMGNEGFVALEVGGSLEWSLFCDASNPFTDLKLSGDNVVVKDGHGGTWTLPVASPEDFSIDYTESV